MFNRQKIMVVVAIILIASIVTGLFPKIESATAQEQVPPQPQATVNIMASFGGTTDPQPGTYNYDDGTAVTLTATADTDFVFETWVISTNESSDTITDNPFTLTVSQDVTYDVTAIFGSAIFEPIPSANSSSPASVYATLTVLHAVGGHTTPGEGTYYLPNASPIQLMAIPDNGWKFDHWVISGENASGTGESTYTITNSSLAVNCGYGYTYAYQPVFAPISGSTPSATPSTSSAGMFSTENIVIIVVVVIILLVLVIAAYYFGSRRKR